MDRFLKPDKLDTDPGAENAENQWTYWKVTFNNFVATFTGDAALSNEAKKAALINCVSPSVYTYISTAATYDAAITILEDIYKKPKNEVYVRHCLSSRKQQDGESVDQYMHALDVLSKKCEFGEVTAAVYRDEYVRDSFIRGLQSSEVR